MRGWRRVYSSAVRRGYALACGGLSAENGLRDRLKADFSNKGIDAWLIHCATLEALTLFKQVPDGKMIFGGKDEFKRRCKGLISRDEWREKRLRPLRSVGDAFFSGNRHFRLDADGRVVTLTILGRAVQIMLPECAGKWGRLLPAISRLAANNEMALSFRLSGKHLDITFDEMDLRRLAPGVSLRAAKDKHLQDRGRKRRGRPRGASYANPLRLDLGAGRPVHPEWKDALPAVTHRALAIDLNPDWIGLAVVENKGDVTRLSETKLLDYRSSTSTCRPGVQTN